MRIKTNRSLQLAIYNWQKGSYSFKLLTIYCLLLTIFLLFSCKPKQEPMEENVFYTCSMDPQVMEKHAGKCPICRMELAKVTMSKEDMESKSIKINNEQMMLANIKVDSLSQSMIAEEKTLTGTAVANENGTHIVATRVAGRIETIYFKSAGERIKERQPIYDIYSEELSSIQQEYILALKEKRRKLKGEKFNYDSFINSAKNKLLLYGMTEEQLTELQSNGKIQTIVTIYSKFSGIIMNINARIGDYLMEGDPILKASDITSLWVEAQLYSNEIADLTDSSEATVTIASFPDKVMKGKISFVNLELVENSKINLIRMQINNSDTLFRPGMMAYITLKTNEKKAITVPYDAVIRNKNYSSVWIQNKKGSFDVRMVELGITNSDRVEIKSGLKEGEKVVISGAYLLNSEYIFKKGADPMADMKM